MLATLIATSSALAQSLASQKISFVPVASRPANSAPFQVVALSSSYLPVVLKVASGPATIDGRLVTLTGAGMVTITASQAGNTAYASTTSSLTFRSEPVVPILQWPALASTPYGKAIDVSSLETASASASPLIQPVADSAVLARSSTSVFTNTSPVYAPGNSAFRYEGTLVTQNPETSDDGGWNSTALPAPYGIPYRIAFTCDCSEFEVELSTSHSAYRLWVDGAWSSPDATNDTGQNIFGRTFVLVTFPDKRIRQIKFETIWNPLFFGINTLPGDTISVPQTPIGPSVFIFGDSWSGPTIGTPAIGPAQAGMMGGGYPEALGEYFNWNYWTDGIGGTGFSNTGSDGDHRTWVQRLVTDVCANKAQGLFLMGSTNDGGAAEAPLQAAVETSLAELDACIPSAPLYYFGTQMLQPVNEQAAAAAAAAYPHNLYYFDEGEKNWFYGSETDASTGNAYLYFNGHPTPLGHDYWAEQIIANLLTAFPNLQPAPYTLMNPAPVAGSFKYSLPTGLPSAGPHAVTASFLPADTTGSVAGASATQTLTVTQASTSVRAAVVQQSNSITLSAAVAPQYAGTPTGSIAWSIDGIKLPYSLPVINGVSVIVIPFAVIPLEGVVFAATYSGDTNFTPSASVASYSFHP